MAQFQHPTRRTPPSRAARTRRWSKPPNGAGRAGLAIFHLPTKRPAPDRKRSDPPCLAGQLQPAGGNARTDPPPSPYFPHHRGEAAGAQGGFHRSQHPRVVIGARQHQPPRIQMRYSRRMKIGTARHPQHRTTGWQAGEQPGDEGRRQHPGFRPHPGGGHFVQRPQREAPMRQAPIQPRIAEREHARRRQCRMGPFPQEFQMRRQCPATPRGIPRVTSWGHDRNMLDINRINRCAHIQGTRMA